MSVEFKFGNYVFSGTGALVSDIDIRETKRIRSQVVPRKDGANIEEALLEPILVSFKGTLEADSQANLRSKRDDFFNAILDGTQNLYIFSDRFVVAQKRSLRYAYSSQMKFMDFDLSFIGQTPFWIASTASQDVQPTAITGGTHVFDVNFIGSAYALPTITIEAVAEVSNISLENKTTDERFSFIGNVLATAALIINGGDASVQNSGVDTIGDYSGDFLRLVQGTNSLEYTGGDVVITFDYYARYF